MENTSSWAFCVNAFYSFHIVLGEICFSSHALTHTLLVFLVQTVSVSPLSWSAPVQYRPAIHSVCRRVGKHPGFVHRTKSLSQFLCLCASLFLNNTSKSQSHFLFTGHQETGRGPKGTHELCALLPATSDLSPEPMTSLLRMEGVLCCFDFRS